MKKLFILLCLCATTPLIAQNINPIQEAIGNYDYETAILLIDKEKPSAALLFQKAKALKGLNRYSEAMTALQQVVTAEPENYRALIEMAECYKSAAKYSDAIKCYEQVLRSNPDNKYIQLQYINLLCNLERFEKAREMCDKYLSNDSSAVSLHLQGQCLEGQNELLPAAGIYHIIREKYPNDYLSAAKLGSIYNDLKKYQDAIECTEEYRKIDSTNLIVNRQNAMAYCLAQTYPVAVQRYDALLNQGDSTYLTCYYGGVSNYAVEDYYKAHDLLEIAHQNQPSNVNLLYYLARACAKTSWKKEGVEYIEQAIKLTVPSDTVMLNLYRGATDCYKMANMYDKQIDALKVQYKYAPTNHKLLYDIATVYKYALKDTPSTERCLEAFLKTKPKEDKTTEDNKINSKGEIVVGIKNYYNAAEKWLSDLRKEKFFKEGAPQKEGTLKTE